MERFVKGDIVVVPFPYTDLSGASKRPAYVATVLKGNDVVLCQITSRQRNEDYSIKITRNQFASGMLPRESYVRTNRLFTVDSTIIQKKVGQLQTTTVKLIQSTIAQLFA